MGRAPHTKETLPNFREWCRATRHQLLFRGLTGCQRTPGNGVSHRLRHRFIILKSASVVIFKVLNEH